MAYATVKLNELHKGRLHVTHLSGLNDAFQDESTAPLVSQST
jgi:hypothetical protein